MILEASVVLAFIGYMWWKSQPPKKQVNHSFCVENFKIEKFRENFIDGKKEGLTEKYYDSGEVWIAENHKDGAYHGLVEYFNKDGNLQKTETWNDGNMIDEVNH